MFYIVIVTNLLCLALAQLNTSCKEPRNLNKQLDQLYDEIRSITLSGESTYGIIPPYRQTPLFKNFKPFPQTKAKTMRYRIYGKSKCSSSARGFGKSHLNYRSTCPWYVNLDYDQDRTPQIMAKAECSCRKCFNASGDGQSGNCQKVLSYVPVIRRSCPPGKRYYEYKVFMETVPVGCTCTRSVSV